MSSGVGAMESVQPWVFFGALNAVVLSGTAALVRREWAHFRGAGTSFNWRLIDLWTFALALTPTAFSAGAISRYLGHAEIPFPLNPASAAWMIAILLIGQITGGFLGRVSSELSSFDGAKGERESTIRIVSGALLGWIAAAAVIGLAVLLFAIA